ncbi:hypothetical protein [Coleofasciculus sp. F4-SAH-05]|uniref:hypothetical protein n=1 Tax=Coleofasciculus sp. F4-SAH-05 TaxID=3069525 RepID=UPI0032F4E7FE
MAMVRNLLVNGDFSEGNTGWEINPYTDSNGNTSSAEIVPGTNSSKPYLKLTDTTGDVNYVVQQTVSVKPYTRYDLITETFYLEGRGRIWRKKYDQPNSSRSSVPTATEAISRNQEVDEVDIRGNWRVHFFTEQYDKLVIYFTGASNSASQEFIAGLGQVVLYEQDLVKNGNFDEKTVGEVSPMNWELVPNQSEAYPKVVNPDGNNILEIPYEAKAYQTIDDIRPNTEYRLSFRSRGEYGGKAKVAIEPSLLDFEPIINENQQWQHYPVNFTTESDTTSIKIVLSAETNAANFDDFSLAKTQRAAQL